MMQMRKRRGAKEELDDRVHLLTEAFDMSRWTHMKHYMIFGDVNAHSPLWDFFNERTDKKDGVIENW